MVITLSIVALLRIVAWDVFEPFAIVNTLTAFVYLPAWVVLVVAAVGRRVFLAGAALLVVLAQIAFLYPSCPLPSRCPGGQPRPPASVCSMPTSTRGTRRWPAMPGRSQRCGLSS